MRYELSQLPPGAQNHHKDLVQFAKRSCCDSPIYVVGNGAPPMVVCRNCGTYVGDTSWSWWEDLRLHTELMSYYNERYHRFCALLQENPNWEVFMVTEKPRSVDDPALASMLQVLPGHIVWENPDKRQSGEFCTHRFVLFEDPEDPEPSIPKAKCLLCGGVRTVSEGELLVIDEAAQAGVVFLKWQDRFEELSNLKGTRKSRRRRARGTRTSKATGGVQTGTAVPDGFIPVKEAAAKLNTEPKKLRRALRAGHYEAIKVAGKVYAKID